MVQRLRIQVMSFRPRLHKMVAIVKKQHIEEEESDEGEEILVQSCMLNIRATPEQIWEVVRGDQYFR